MSTYLLDSFTRVIPRRRVETIVECGSRDCVDAILLKQYYHANKVYAFECNPESIEVCKENIDGYDIFLIEKAVSNINGIVDFYPTDMEKSTDKNIGASSLYFHRDQVNYVQKKIQVESTRLDTWMDQEKICGIDLLCLDLQGAELLAFQGLGERIKDVKYIITEVNFKSYYHGDHLVDEVDKYLKGRNFRMLAGYGKINFGNYLYINNE